MSATCSATCSAIRAPAIGVGAASTRSIGRAAIVALYDELALPFKPGLVSMRDAGSHDDMDAATFMRSLFALRHYFQQIAAAGARQAAFAELEQLGIHAELAMLRATGGINTHRGAIFSLGLLCASAGGMSAAGTVPTPAMLRQHLLDHWGADLHRRRAPRDRSTGRPDALRAGMRSAGIEAAAGFPTLFDVTWPALQRARASGLGAPQRRLQALFETIAVLDDTNLAQRGGADGLRWAQWRARDFLAAGGAAQPDARAQVRSIHQAFIDRRLSPGGSADMLAAACCVERLTALR